MKRYFKKRYESEIGRGFIYIEFTGDWATRQAEIYDGKWFNSNKRYHFELGPGLADQPFSEMDLSAEDEISSDEFEAAWYESQQMP